MPINLNVTVFLHFTSRVVTLYDKCTIQLSIGYGCRNRCRKSEQITHNVTGKSFRVTKLAYTISTPELYKRNTIWCMIEPLCGNRIGTALQLLC